MRENKIKMRLFFHAFYHFIKLSFLLLGWFFIYFSFFLKQNMCIFSSTRKILKRKSTDTKRPDNKPIKTQIGEEKIYLPELPKARKILFCVLLATAVKTLPYF